MGLTPKVVKVTESNALDSAGKLIKAVVISYTVGNHGPFTLSTTQTDLLNGRAMQQMQEFASGLATLPGFEG